MTAPSALNNETRKSVAAIARADILVGIPSYNNEKTIGHVTEAIKLGLAKYYPDARAVIFNSDGGSEDQTRAVFERIAKTDSYDTFFISKPRHPLENISGRYIGIPGKGSAFKAIFEETLKIERVPDGKTTPSEVLIKRCENNKIDQSLLNIDENGKWDGVFTLTSK